MATNERTEAALTEKAIDDVVDDLEEKTHFHTSSGSTSSQDAAEKADIEAKAAIQSEKKHRRRKNKSTSSASRPEKPPKPSAATKSPFEHLPRHEREILQRQVDLPVKSIGYKTLYRYASKWDLCLLVFCWTCAIGAGSVMPLMTVVFGNLGNSFSGAQQGATTPQQFQGTVSKYVLYFVYLGIGEFVLIYVSTVGFMTLGERIASNTREKYLEAILRQNIAFFDKLGAGEITTRITTDTSHIQDAISEKVGLTLTAATTFLAAFVVGFVRNWRLTAILISVVVAIFLVGAFASRFVVKFSRNNLMAYAGGSTVAEEVLSSIRNTQAFSTQGKLSRMYQTHLKKALYWGIRQKSCMGVIMGTMMCIANLNTALAFWQGSRFLVEGKMNLAQILTIMMAVMIGSFSLNSLAPNFQAFAVGIAAGQKIFNTIDRKSPLDPTSAEGEKLDAVKGSVELVKVKHIYPSRPEVTIMEDVSIKVPAGSTTALVGASGSGKSTIIGLIERFYEPVGGKILLDGHDITGLNLRWLRQQIALVSQEPILFSTSIFSNIAFGLIGTKHEGASHEEKLQLVEQAARMANAHEFISILPDKYDTKVGDRGFLLSGGQRQRIAIARAVVGDPKVLLLDEATSALDTKSEGVVQAALDKASQGRTTIVIAHRLSTIRNADNIIVMSEGKIVEQGTHNQLLEKQETYYNLVEAQRIADMKAEQALEIDPLAVKEEAVIEKVLAKAPNIDVADIDILETLDRSKTTKSVSSVALKKRVVEKDKKYSLWTLMRFIVSFNRKEWHFLLIGFCASAIAGLITPVGSVFFAKCILAMSVGPSQYAQLRHSINFYAGLYVMLAFVILIVMSTQGIMFAYCSEKLVYRARDLSFKHMMRQDVEYFDEDYNSAGALTSFLATETTFLAGISGTTLGTIVTMTVTLVGAFCLSVAIGWKLALVTSSLIPILIGCGFLRFRMLAKFRTRSRLSYEQSAAYACEATSAIRTVASLTREYDVFDNYSGSVTDQKRKSFINVCQSTTLFAAANSLMFLCIGLAFWYGGRLIGRGEYNVFQFFVCYQAIIQGAQSSGAIFSFAPDMGKAQHAAGRLKKLFDQKPHIDAWAEDGASLEKVEGYIELRDVHFRYPTRPQQPILRGLNISVKPGQYVALVGASGCGKSTTIQLLERFYDPLSGSVLIDGKDVSTLNVNDYRSFLALVSQEPTLYQGTIRENITLGVDNDDVPEEAIIRACKDANIYDFITSLPDSFSTVVGTKGTLLSGGQKQRIAIARALLRDPKVLLLDEATSALDSESEKVVQAALDAAMRGRTTIAVAHRLSTIQRADLIYVIDQGVCVEQGTHRELMEQRGRYFELVNMQSLEKSE